MISGFMFRLPEGEPPVETEQLRICSELADMAYRAFAGRMGWNDTRGGLLDKYTRKLTNE